MACELFVRHQTGRFAHLPAAGGGAQAAVSKGLMHKYLSGINVSACRADPNPTQGLLIVVSISKKAAHIYSIYPTDNSKFKENSS